MRNLITSLMATVACAQSFGGVGEKKKINFEGERTAEHLSFFNAVEHDEVKAKLQSLAGSTKLRPIEYATQVVQGLKYIVTMKDDEQKETYEVHIWQKPFNNVKNEMPAPEVVKLIKINSTEDL